MARKKTKYQKKSFESDGRSDDVSANLYLSMLTNEKWLALSKSQQVLYLYCKLQHYSEKRKPQTFDNSLSTQEQSVCFTMNRQKWLNEYHLYGAGGADCFTRDMKTLINNGFIEIVENGKITRTKSIYKFSDKWHTLPNTESIPVKTTLPLTSSDGYLYVVKLDSAYKIGISKNPKQRLKEFTLLPYKLETIVCEKVYDYAQLEAELHLFFSDKHMRGEWYKLEESDITKIKNIVAMRKV